MEEKKVYEVIKKYEPMMHKLLKRFKITRDYEDILQELRLETWQSFLLRILVRYFASGGMGSFFMLMLPPSLGWRDGRRKLVNLFLEGGCVMLNLFWVLV